MWLNYIDLAPALISGSNTFFHINKTNCEDEIIGILQLHVDCRYKRDFPPCNEMNVATALRSHYGCQMINLKPQAGAVLNMCDGIT